MYKVKFKTDKKRDLFFNSIKKEFNNWKEISNYLEVNRNTLLRYKTGESLIPSHIFELLKKYNKLKNINKDILLFDSNWGQKLGGKRNYQKNKWIFDLGRKKALAIHKKTDNKILDLNLNSPELAEFIGVLIGDGFIGKYGRHMLIQITGHKINDRAYYCTYLIPLIKKIFNVDAKFYERDTCIRLSIYSKVVFNTIKKVFDFPVGRKLNLSIPKNIIKTKECKISLIRGIFDTDGSISLQRGKYPVISITTISEILAKQMQEILNEFNFGAYICRSKGRDNYKDSFRVVIFGKQKVLKWKKLINSSNPYHLNRIEASVAQIV